jgi:hypothetical protein
MKRDRELAALKQTLARLQATETDPIPTQEDPTEAPYDDLFQFIEKINLGIDEINNEIVDRLRAASDWQWQDKDGFRPLLTENEIYNLVGPEKVIFRDTVLNESSLTTKATRK